MTKADIYKAIKTGEITRWGSALSDTTVLVRDESDEGGNCAFSWSTTGERWYSSTYQTVRESAALAHGCATGIGTRVEDMQTLGVYGGTPLI